MIVVKVRDREIRIAPTAPVTSGSVGLPVTWTFSEEWEVEGLAKTAVFRGSGTARDVVLTEDTCVVPADVLMISGGPLEIGVRGVQITHDEDTDEDVVTVVIPTIWGRIDRIYDGTIPAEADPSVPEPDWTEQVKAAATEALAVANGVRQDADDGEFDGATFTPSVSAAGVISWTNDKGKQNPNPVDIRGPAGTNGKSAYEIAVDNGFVGTPTEWLASLVGRTGDKGDDGKSAYQSAVDGGYEGTEAEFRAELASISASAETATDAAEAAEAAQTAAETAVTHYPKIVNNYWYVWDSSSDVYVNTGVSATGVQGEDGADGVSPTVTFNTITGGHRMTVTDKDHPSGQSINIMDGSGGGGTTDYDDLTNQPSINGTTLSGNKTAAQLGLAAASDIPTVPVQSVNGKTGAVVLSASDVGAGTYSKPSGGIPKTDLASAVRTSLGKADTALQSAPVTSVNSKTGAVSLSASDVGALPDDTAIPSKTSDLTNDSGFLTSAPVTSVNNKTGAVTLTASDVGAGTYSKPSGGIPQTDLASAVQGKLDNTVAISATQPTATENKLWVDTDAGTGSTYQIPTVAEMEAADAQTAAEIGIVITGARPSIAVTAGQYVIVRNSTISGITDGLYTANSALSPSTDVTAANLTAVSNGGLNDLQSQFTPYEAGYSDFNSSAFQFESWGRIYVYVSGHVCIIGISGLKPKATLASNTIAFKIPFQAKSAVMTVLTNGGKTFIQLNKNEVYITAATQGGAELNGQLAILI